MITDHYGVFEGRGVVMLLSPLLGYAIKLEGDILHMFPCAQGLKKLGRTLVNLLDDGEGVVDTLAGRQPRMGVTRHMDIML